MQSVANANGVAKCYCDGYCHCNGYSDSHSYFNSDSHSYGNCDCNPNQYARAYAEVYSKPEASPNAAAPLVGRVSRDYLTLMWELANEPASSPSDFRAVRDYSFAARATKISSSNAQSMSSREQHGDLTGNSRVHSRVPTSGVN